MPNITSDLDQQMESFKGEFRRVHQEVSKVIVGYSDLIDDILMTILGSGHVLLEGVPGLGKTKLVQTLSRALHLRSSRIQFTPDLMPADIVGTNVVQETEHGEKFLDSSPGLFSPTSFSQTRSTGRLRRRNPHSWKRCRRKPSQSVSRLIRWTSHLLFSQR